MSSAFWVAESIALRRAACGGTLGAYETDAFDYLARAIGEL